MCTNVVRLLLLLALGPLLSEVAHAQDRPPVAPRDTINADRPDQTESPHTVPKGRLQLEAGLTLNPYDSSGGDPAALIGMLVLRCGIGRRLELRAMAEEGRGRDRYLDETTQGVMPLAVGAKYILHESKAGPVPQVALLGWLKLPFTSRTAEQKRYWSPQMLLAFENRIGEHLELEYNAGVKQEVYGTDWQGMASASLHVELTGRLRIFGEYFGQYQPGNAPMHNADGGLLYYVSPSVQVDVSAGGTLGAAHNQANGFVMIGASALLP